MLQPVGKRIIIQPVVAPVVAIEQRILITNQKPTQFTVISVGDEVTKVTPGNIVYLEKHYGVEIDYEKEKFLVIDEGSILAKINN